MNAPPTTPRDGWAPGIYEMTFRLGELGLFCKRFPALLLRTHFLDLPSDLAQSRPPLERLGGPYAVILVRSHPVQCELPTLERVEGGVLRYVIARYQRCHIDLSGDFEGYLARFSGKTRATLRRKVRRFVEHPDVGRVREFSRPEQMEEFHRLARRVSRLTYQESLLDAGLPEDVGFVSRLVDLASRDEIRGYLLLLGDTPVAYLCCPVTDGVLLYAYLGYDPTRADLSPGTVLQYLALESLFAERRFRAFDFTEGQGEHKRFFATHETACADISFFADTPSARLWIGLHRALDWMSTRVGDIAGRLGVKAQLKRFLRRR